MISPSAFASLSLLFLVPLAAQARTWRVASDGTGDAATIQAGIDLCVTGDTVEIACGTYAEYDVRIDTGIIVRSVTGTADCVRIDAEERGRVFLAESVTAPIRLEGLTLVGGRTPSGEYGGPANVGGGIFLDNCTSFAMERCALRGGFAHWKGGGLGSINSNVTIRECRITENRADRPDFALGTAGGGVFGEAGSLLLRDSLFEGNYAGSGIAGGGALFWIVSPVDIAGCTFRSNVANWRGGAVAVGAGGMIRDCVFQGNLAPVEQGGGLLASGGFATVTVIDCLFAGNSAPRGGGLSARSLVLQHCTVVANHGGGVLLTDPFVQRFENVIIANNEGAAVSGPVGSPHSVQCTDVFGNTGGNWAGPIAGDAGINRNFSADPHFCNPERGSFYLQWGSPCLPANSLGCGLVGALGAGACGPVSVTATSWGHIKASHR